MKEKNKGANIKNQTGGENSDNKMFTAKYLLFKYLCGSSEKQNPAVLTVPLTGTYNAYRYRMADAEKSEEKICEKVGSSQRQLSLFWSSRTSGIKADEIIPAAKFLCEICDLGQVCVMDKDADTATVIKRKLNPNTNGNRHKK